MRVLLSVLLVGILIGCGSNSELEPAKPRQPTQDTESTQDVEPAEDGKLPNIFDQYWDQNPVGDVETYRKALREERAFELYHILLREAERKLQDPNHKGEFMGCDVCRAAPGMSELCRGCLHNRAVISELKRKN